MTALVATPDTAGRSVLLEVTGYPAERALEILRADTNGTRRVRLPRGAAAVAGAYTVRDHEAALTGPLEYSVIGGTRTNEITNPSLDTDLTGWTAGGPATIARDVSTGHTGTTSLRLDSTATGGNAQYSAKVPIPAELRVPTTKVFLGVWAKGSGSIQVLAQGQDAANANTVSAATVTTALTGAWTRHTVTLTINASTTKVVPIIFQRSGGVISLWLDSVLCELNPAEPTPAYFAGTLTDQEITTVSTLEDAARPAGPFIHAAAHPTSLATLTGGLVVGWRPTRDTGAQLVDVIGRADAIDTGPALARTRALTLDVRADTLAAARALEELVTASRTVVVRHNTPGIDATVTVEALDGPHPDPGNPRRWFVTLRGRETLTGPYLADPPT